MGSRYKEDSSKKLERKSHPNVHIGSSNRSLVQNVEKKKGGEKG